MHQLTPGDHAVLRLTGSRNYEVSAHILGVDSTGLRIRTHEGRELRVPHHAVTVLEVLTQTRATPPTTSARLPIDELLAALSRRSAALPIELMPTLESGQSAPLPSCLAEIRTVVEALQDRVVNAKYLTALQEVHELIEVTLDRLNTSDFTQALIVRERFTVVRKTTKSTLDRLQTSSDLSKALKEALRGITQSELNDWNRFSRRFEANPHLVVTSKLALNLDANGEFKVPLRISLENAEVPARGIRVVLEQHRGVEVLGNIPSVDELLPGGSVTVHARMMDRRRQGARDDVRMTAHLEYLGPNKELLTSPRHKLTLKLRRVAAFQPIGNPFREFASGIPVDNPRMFFGRDALIGDILDQLLKRPTGRCYGLYGQKRTGKSSVIEQVRSRLSDSGALVASVSMGVVDRSSITASFVAEVLDQLREQVAQNLDQKRFESLLTRWPDQHAVMSQPLASFRKACTAARALTGIDGDSEVRIIVIVDEFTYLYELLRRDNVAVADQNQLRDFMRQWKSLLEAKNFSALVVGQDTMPYFLEAFPNEFSVMHTERLDYLSAAETESLADNPIQRTDGSSRFVGFGLPTIYSYTAGHPYFTQILCDRIVSTVNEAERMEISEFDVDAAIESLLSGPREIGFHRFDCLLSADNTGVIVSELNSPELTEFLNKDMALKIVHRLATIAGQQNKPTEKDALHLTMAEERVYRDLVLRQVIIEREGRAQIKVSLFSEYLRRLSA